MSLKLNTASSGSVTLEPANTASNYTLTVPAQTGTVVATDSSGNVGIGTSSPSGASSAKVLNVYGFGNAQTIIEGGSGTSFLATYSGTSSGDPSALYFNQPLRFATATAKDATGFTERMRIDSSGNLLVGTTTAAARVTFAGATTSAGSFALKVTNSVGTLLLGTRDDGYVTLPQNYNLTTGAAANMWFDASGYPYRSTSSLKYKKNVQDAVHGLTDLMNLRSVTYEGKSEADEGKTFGGLIAEEVHEAGLTEFVQYAEDGTPDALHYGNMVSLCVKAIQELKAELDTVKTELATLKGQA